MLSGNRLRYGLIALILLGVPFAVWALVDQPKCADVIRLLEKEENGAVSGHNEGTVTCERDCEVLFSFPDTADDESNVGYHDQNGKCDTADELDLLAQNSMAHWAKVSAGLALGALCGLFLTLWETRRIGQAQARAYVSCPAGAFKFSNSDYTEIDVRIDVHNSGTSPAVDFEFSATIIVEYVEDDEVIVAGKYPFSTVLKIYDVGGGETQPKRAKLVGSSIVMWVQYLLRNNAEIGVFGQFEYIDVFKRKWVRKFALAGRVEKRKPDSEGFVINELVPCHPDRWEEKKAGRPEDGEA